VVGLFALLGFAYVPLGSKTGLQHVSTLLQTEAVKDAASGLAARLLEARLRIADVLAPKQISAPLPLPSGSAHGVRPVVPKLTDHGTTR
jgi:hypothetical protein